MLNRNPENYFAEVEQAAFEPSNIVPGIGFSPDKMLQARIFAYPDTHRYRIGANYQLLPVNRARHPEARVRNYQRDGSMRFDDNGGRGPNYEPNSFGGPVENPALKEAAYGFELRGFAERFDKEYPGNDDYTQAGNLFRLMKPDERERLIGNIVEHMRPVRREIQLRQIRQFHKADPAYGEGVAAGLGIETGEIRSDVAGAGQMPERGFGEAALEVAAETGRDLGGGKGARGGLTGGNR